MPTALSVDSFVDLVQRSRLLSSNQIQQALQELEAEGVQIDSPETLADALVRRELLTSWQIGFLLKGKHQGFFLGPYRFLKMLGKGGMGAVYLAEHQMMRRRCAIKVLPNKLIDDNTSVLDRFYLEAQAVAALDDPNIVRAYDVNKEMQGKREIHYLVMEYIDGCDLQVLVQRKGPLDFVQVADFARQAASGLAHAHDCGLIHRDIKPANLLIDEKGTVKILDLGLARFFDDRLDASLTTTHNESILGTADYLSPEQALDSHNVDTRTDVYSLGCTCYYMLTGHPPFPEGSVAQRLLSHQTKSPTAIEKTRPDIPADLVTIVEKMIAKKPADRYQTSREVAEAFTAWLAEHADEDWKKEHREFADGLAALGRQEPTRARSAATEETDLELGLAPDEELGLAPDEDDDAPSAADSSVNQAAAVTAPLDNSGAEELGLDQLEELEPLTTDIDTGSSSGGLDNLLNEALDNYPTLDPNLAVSPDAPATASGPQPVVKAPSAGFEPNHLFKLILIGFAVSIPLCVVILFVSNQFSATDEPPSRAVSAVPPAHQVPLTGDERVSEAQTPTSPAPAAPTPGAEGTGREQEATTFGATSTGEPPLPPEQGPETESEPREKQPGKTTPQETQSATTAPVTTEPVTTDPATTEPATAPTTTKKILTADTSPTATTDTKAGPEANDVSPVTQPATTTPSGDGAVGDEAAETNKPKSGPTAAERAKELLAGLSEVTVQLDRKSTRQSYAYDQLVIREARQAMQRLGLSVIDESEGPAAAVLMLSLSANKAEAYVVFNLVANLKCRDGDAQEVSLCEHQGEVLKVRSDALSSTPISVLRNHVSDFFIAFGKKYRQTKADGK